MKRSLFLAIATIALVAVPRVSSAQLGVLKPIQLGIAGGAAQPMSDLKTSSDIGYNGTVAMADQPAVHPGWSARRWRVQHVWPEGGYPGQARRRKRDG